jgi:hypothetical protein
VSSGCGARQTWHFTLKSQNDKAVIDMPSVTLIFEGVSVPLPEGQAGGGAGGSLGVAGPGTSKITVTAFGKSFTNSYNNGVNTMTFEGHSLKLLNAGTKLQIGTQEIDLIGEKKTVVIHKDGSAEVQKLD